MVIMVEILTLPSNTRGRIFKINHIRFLLELGSRLTLGVVDAGLPQQGDQHEDADVDRAE